MYRSLFIVFLALFLSTVLTVKHVKVPDATFNVVDYGAKGDGKTLDTKAIQAAFDAAAKAGGGTVLFPAGTYLTFPFSFSGSSTILSVAKGAIIRANPDLTNWPVSKGSGVAFITGSNLKNIAITGPGTIDGQGAPWWAAFRAKTLKIDRPHLLVLHGSNVDITNVTFINSPNHNLELYTNNTYLYGVTVTAPADSPNTDAVDIHGAPFWITQCHFSVGDDNIAGHASNSLIENSYFGSGHGASIGSVSVGSIQNVTFRNIIFNGTTNGARIKTDPGAEGYVRNVVYESLTMNYVENHIVVTMFYPEDQVKQTSLKISDIQFKQITARNGKNAGIFECQPSSPCEGIVLQDVNIQGNVKPYKCENASGTQVNVEPKACLQ